MILGRKIPKISFFLHFVEKIFGHVIFLLYFCRRNEIILQSFNIKNNTIMAQTAMTVRLDNRVKAQFDSLCEQFGMSANAAVNVFINAVVRTRAIPFTISVSEDPVRRSALDAFYSADRSNRPEMSLDEINEEIRAARRERKERMQKATV